MRHRRDDAKEHLTERPLLYAEAGHLARLDARDESAAPLLADARDPHRGHPGDERDERHEMERDASREGARRPQVWQMLRAVAACDVRDQERGHAEQPG